MKLIAAALAPLALAGCISIVAEHPLRFVQVDGDWYAQHNPAQSVGTPVTLLKKPRGMSMPEYHRRACKKLAAYKVAAQSAVTFLLPPECKEGDPREIDPEDDAL